MGGGGGVGGGGRSYIGAAVEAKPGNQTEVSWIPSPACSVSGLRGKNRPRHHQRAASNRYRAPAAPASHAVIGWLRLLPVPLGPGQGATVI